MMCCKGDFLFGVAEFSLSEKNGVVDGVCTGALAPFDDIV